MKPICYYSSSENINCHSIQAARKKYANDIKCALDFYYDLPFTILKWQHLSLNIWADPTDGRLNAYLS